MFSAHGPTNPVLITRVAYTRCVGVVYHVLCFIASIYTLKVMQFSRVGQWTSLTVSEYWAIPYKDNNIKIGMGYIKKQKGELSLYGKLIHCRHSVVQPWRSNSWLPLQIAFFCEVRLVDATVWATIDGDRAPLSSSLAIYRHITEFSPSVPLELSVERSQSGRSGREFNWDK